MTTTYQPGTLAHIDLRGADYGTVVALWTGVFWAWVPKDGSGPFEGLSKAHANAPTEIRPLVVLDPVDLATYDLTGAAVKLRADGDFNGTANLLAELAAANQPPRIPEPGLWGVVDAPVSLGGYVWQWVHHPKHVWLNAEGDSTRWDSLIDPTLIREGVEP